MTTEARARLAPFGPDPKAMERPDEDDAPGRGTPLSRRAKNDERETQQEDKHPRGKESLQRLRQAQHHSQHYQDDCQDDCHASPLHV